MQTMYIHIGLYHCVYVCIIRSRWRKKAYRSSVLLLVQCCISCEMCIKNRILVTQVTWVLVRNRLKSCHSTKVKVLEVEGGRNDTCIFTGITLSFFYIHCCRKQFSGTSERIKIVLLFQHKYSKNWL